MLSRSLDRLNITLYKLCNKFTTHKYRQILQICKPYAHIIHIYRLQFSERANTRSENYYRFTHIFSTRLIRSFSLCLQPLNINNLQMKYKYTIIWSNKQTDNELVSWLGTTHESMQEANVFAAQVAHELWETMPNLSWRVMKHLFSWRTVTEKNEEPF